MCYLIGFSPIILNRMEFTNFDDLKNLPVGDKGESKLSYGMMLLAISSMNRDSDHRKQALEAISEALTLGLSHEKQGLALSALGTAYFNRWKFAHDRKDLDWALYCFSISSSAALSRMNFEQCIDIGGAFFSRYQLEHKNKDLNEAIQFLKTAESLMKHFGAESFVNFSIPLKNLLGKVYYERYRCNHNSEDLEESLSYLQFVCAYYEQRVFEDINIDSDKHGAFYDYGIALLERWKEFHISEDLKKSIKNLQSSLESAECFFNCYLALRDAFYEAELESDGDKCINTSLYLLFRGKARWQDRFPNIIRMIPSNHLFDALQYILYNKTSLSLIGPEIDRGLPSKDFAVILKYLNSGIEESVGIISKPVLLSYLGGTVSSYIVFDEFLDNNPNYTLSAQEQYYYVRAALSFHDQNKTLFSADSILKFAISSVEKQNPSSSKDLYYLGQLYYLQGLMAKEKSMAQQSFDSAKSCFSKCNNSIWSKAMLIAIESDYSHISMVREYINNNCNDIRIISKANINSPLFLEQFSDYFHFNEICYACPSFVSRCLNYGSELEFSKPIWEVFRLSQNDYKQLEYDMRHSIGKAIQKEAADQVASSSIPLEAEEINRIKDDWTEFSKLRDTRRIEDKAQGFIRDSKMSRNDITILLRYLLQKSKIDNNQFYTLLKFNEYCEIKEKEQKKLNDLKGTGRALASIFSVILLHDFGITGFLVTYTITKFSKVEMETYSSFKDSLWKVLNNEYLIEEDYAYFN